MIRNDGKRLGRRFCELLLKLILPDGFDERSEFGLRYQRRRMLVDDERDAVSFIPVFERLERLLDCFSIAVQPFSQRFERLRLGCRKENGLDGLEELFAHDCRSSLISSNSAS